MNRYELVVIMGSQVADEEVPDAVERLIQRPVEGWGGSIEQTDHWGRRKLAYPIRRNVEGNYVLAQFQLAPDRTKDLERGLMISEEVIRHLLIRLDEQPA